MLEDDVIGPLYRTIAGRPPIAEHDALGPRGYRHLKHFLTGPGAFSVSKINQIVSLFVTILWLPMIGMVIWPLNPAVSIDVFEVIVLGLAGITCILIVASGGSDSIDFTFYVSQRESQFAGKTSKDK
jgi:hypothetical protein